MSPDHPVVKVRKIPTCPDCGDATAPIGPILLCPPLRALLDKLPAIYGGNAEEKAKKLLERELIGLTEEHVIDQ